jgi:hypothetical protein
MTLSQLLCFPWRRPRKSLSAASGDVTLVNGGHLSSATQGFPGRFLSTTPDQHSVIAQPPTHPSPPTNFEPSEHRTQLAASQHLLVPTTASQDPLHSQRPTVSLPDITRK